MGLFTKLFGNKDDITDEIKKAEKPAAQNTGFSMPVLRTVRSGGYDKTAVLGMLDSISKEYMLLKEASEAKDKGENFTLPAAADYADIPTVRAGGFSCEDVDDYIKEIKAKIAGLRAGLR